MDEIWHVHEANILEIGSDLIALKERIEILEKKLQTHLNAGGYGSRRS
jgi:hypothetical protein